MQQIETNFNYPEMIFTEKRFSKELEKITTLIQDSVENQTAVHELEKSLWKQLLVIGHQSLQLFFGLSGSGDEGEKVTLPNGDEVKRLKNTHSKSYQSVFGNFELERTVYGTREGQKIEYAPLDSQLQLPESKFSYLLQEWDQSLATEMPFNQVNKNLERILGFNQSVNSLERTGQQLALEVDAFWKAQPLPAANEEGHILVTTADCTGIPICKPEKIEAFEGFETKEPKHNNKKKMALVGATYTIDTYQRTPEEVLDALFRSSKSTSSQPSRPKPKFKRVRASLLRDEADKTSPQVDEIFSWLALEAHQRSQSYQKPLILLMDGQDSLWQAGLKYLPADKFVVTEILDLLHAASYVWDAAHLFYPKKSTEAANFVRERLGKILQGQVMSVIRGLQWKSTHAELEGEKLKKLNQICGYFKNNAHRMAYQDYLKAGYPIASGVIEGACRNVVNDRMERTGMRWSLEGAHAMLGLRSIQLSQLWDDFMQFSINQTSARLYPHSILRKVKKTEVDIAFCAANDENFSQNSRFSKDGVIS
jgi:hypothetical protein